MKRVDDRAVLCTIAIVSMLVIYFCGLVMEYGWFGYGRVDLDPVSAVYSQGEASDPALTEKVDINTATAVQLEALPGIGQTIAQRIVDDRTQNGPYASVEELTRVKGIGEATLEKLKPYITE